MLVVPEAPHQWNWPSGAALVYLSISLTLCSISVSAEIGSFISPPLPVTLIFPLILYLLLFMIYSLSLSYLMLQNGWGDGLCGGRKQRGGILSFTHHRGTDWTHPSIVGDGNPTAAPEFLTAQHCEMPWSQRGPWLSGILGWGLLSWRWAGGTPWLQRTECPLLMGSWDGNLPWCSFHSSSGAAFRKPWDVQGSEQQDTTSVSARLLPTLGFFITRTPRCSWLWEVFCPHTK